MKGQKKNNHQQHEVTMSVAMMGTVLVSSRSSSNTHQTEIPGCTVICWDRTWVRIRRRRTKKRPCPKKFDAAVGNGFQHYWEERERKCKHVLGTGCRTIFNRWIQDVLWSAEIVHEYWLGGGWGGRENVSVQRKSTMLSGTAFNNIQKRRNEYVLNMFLEAVLGRYIIDSVVDYQKKRVDLRNWEESQHNPEYTSNGRPRKRAMVGSIEQERCATRPSRYLRLTNRSKAKSQRPQQKLQPPPIRDNSERQGRMVVPENNLAPPSISK